MANDEVLGPRKTMFVLVIVVGCFAVLWPRILSPLILGHSQEQLKPNQFDREAALKQERSPIRGMGPHPALRERGRAIPSEVTMPPAQTRAPVLPPHVRVRTSPLSVYYESDIKPPPIPGMRPPLGSPGGPVPAPKSSMGFVMPIYTICIIVFFVYTLSKILFKRSCSPYDSVAPDPHFRRRVFRGDSRSSQDKLVVTAISGLVAEVQQQMEAGDAQSQQRQDMQDNPTRPYSNGTILLNSGPVQIIASEFQEPKKKNLEEHNEAELPQSKESTGNTEQVPNSNDQNVNNDASTKPMTVQEEIHDSDKETVPKPEVTELEPGKNKTEAIESLLDSTEEATTEKEDQEDNKICSEAHETKIGETKPTVENIPEENGENESHENVNLVALSEGVDLNKSKPLAHSTELFIKQEKAEDTKEDKQTTPELLEEALIEDSLIDQEEEDVDDKDSPSVKVVGMEVTTHTADGGEWPRAQQPLTAAPPTQPQRPPHEADEVKSIFLETEIPQQARVLVTEFAEDRNDRPQPAKHAPLVVSGKMTLSLIQDAPRETPERDPESTVDDFTTASTMTQPFAEKEDDLSEEEIEEEIEIEEIEEEIEEEEEEEEENVPKNAAHTQLK